MIKLYKPNETDFTHNGIGILDPHIYDPSVEEELNGLFVFKFRYPLFAPYGTEIDGMSIVKAPTPDGDQLFRIATAKPSMGELEVFCYHIFYDLTENLIEDIFPESINGSGALERISRGCQYKHPFVFFSDIPKVSSARIVRKNPVEAILDSSQENSFINRWGGELLRDNFDVKMLNHRGRDRGVEIRHKKNLLGYEGTVDWKSPVTRIMPQGFDGLFLPEKYVDSPLINKYPHPKIRIVEFKHIKAAIGDNADDEGAVPLEEAYKLLRAAAKEIFEVQKVDQPQATYKVEFQELSQTEEYKDFAVLQRVYMSDTVTVIHSEDNLHIQAKVISYKYDPIKKEYTNLTIGNFKNSFTDVMGKLDQMQNELSDMPLSVLEEAKNNATNLINSGFGGHVRVYPERLLIMDTDSEKTTQKVWQWNINGLGYSSKGINGPYETAITRDGRIVADFMTTGTLDASLAKIKNLIADDIESGKLRARNDTFKIDLDRSAIDFYSVNKKISTTISQVRAADGKEITTWAIESTANKDAALSFGKRNIDGSVTQSVYIDGEKGDLYSFAPTFFCHAELNFLASSYFKQPIYFEGAGRFESSIFGRSWSITNHSGFRESVAFNPNTSGSGSLGQSKQVWGEAFIDTINTVKINGRDVNTAWGDVTYAKNRANGAWDYASSNLEKINDLGSGLGTAQVDIQSLQGKTDRHDREIQELRDSLNRKADKEG
ncbi:phage tail spike protein [Bacillus sp. C1]